MLPDDLSPEEIALGFKETDLLVEPFAVVLARGDALGQEPGRACGFEPLAGDQLIGGVHEGLEEGYVVHVWWRKPIPRGIVMNERVKMVSRIAVMASR